MGRNASIFPSSNQYQWAFQRNGTDVVTLRVQPDHREAVGRHLAQHRFQVVGPGDGQVRQGTCGRFFDHRSQPTAPFAGQNHRGDSQSDAGSRDCSKIAGIFDRSRQKDHRRFSLVGLIEEIVPQRLPFHEFPCIADRHHALMSASIRSGKQVSGLDLLDRNPLGFGHFLQFVQPRIAGASFQQQTLDPIRLGRQERFHGVLSANQLGGILRGLASGTERPGGLPPFSVERRGSRPLLARRPVVVPETRALARRRPTVVGKSTFATRRPVASRRRPEAVQDRPATAVRLCTASTNWENR